MNSDEIKRIRTKYGLTQEALARDLCVSKWTVVSWENGRSDMPLCCEKLFCILYGLTFKARRSDRLSEAYRKTPDLFPGSDFTRE